jgi:hypothetical protein
MLPVELAFAAIRPAAAALEEQAQQWKAVVDEAGIKMK